MIVSIEHQRKTYKIETSNFIDLSIPYNFNGPQPNFYDVNPGKLSPYKKEGSSYSVSDGAGCNVPEINMNIHCTGTHTEYVGHLLEKNGSLMNCIQDIFLPTALLSVKPRPFAECTDGYHVDVKENENIIDRESLEIAYGQLHITNPASLVIRTLPNPKEKQFYCFSKQIPPFFTNDAIIFLASKKIQHLIVDLPSLDRMEDDGILGNHRIFWSNSQDPRGSVDANSNRTITELAYIPNEVNDGFYFLNIQVPHFKCDAAPSRPMLIRPA